MEETTYIWRNGERLVQRFGNIVVEIAKLRDHGLSDNHPRGRHKARVFQSRLGLTAHDAQWLRRTLLAAVRAARMICTPPTPTSLASAMCWTSL